MEGRHGLTALLAAVAVAAAAGTSPAAAQDAAGPRVSSTATLGTDPVREGAWAAFFRSLPHGAELGSLNVLLGAGADVSARCGPAADGCYLPAAKLIVMPGGTLPVGTLSEEIARHEYGHHIAAQADNAPFAPGLGTKRWFTHEHICERLRSGELVDDAANGYDRSVAEGFAEAYRVASGGESHEWLVDSALYPDAGAQRAILTDVAHPWTGPRVRVARGLGSATLRVRVPLDGDVSVRATGARRMWLEDATGRRVSRPGQTILRYVDCGARLLRLVVTAGGRFRLAISTP